MKRLVRLSIVGVVVLAVLGCSAQRLEFYTSESGPVKGGHYYAVTTADINGDGVLDLVCGNFEPGGIEVWIGNGDGTWIQSRGPTSEGSTYGLAVGDFNSDGRIDIVSAIKGARHAGVRVWFNMPDGTWQQGPAPTKAGIYGSVLAADINMDGHLDIIAASDAAGPDGGVTSWHGDGKGNWTAVRGPDSSKRYRDIAVADFNNDGILDIVGTAFGYPIGGPHSWSGGVNVWYGDGRGGWFAGESPRERGSYWGVATGDFNGDGIPDIVAGSWQRGVYLWYGDNEKIWTRPLRLTKIGSWYDCEVGDFDSDGRLDIAASSVDGHGVHVWLNKRTKWVEKRLGSPSEPVYHNLVSADFNEDGRIDLAAANDGQGIHVWFQTDQSLLIPVMPQVVAKRSAAPMTSAANLTPEEAPLAARGREGNNVFRWITLEDGTRYPEYIIGKLDRLLITVYTGLEKQDYEVAVSGDWGRAGASGDSLDGETSAAFFDAVDPAGLLDLSERVGGMQAALTGMELELQELRKILQFQTVAMVAGWAGLAAAAGYIALGPSARR